MSTDKEWEEWGKKDPYYGVLAQDKFRNKNLRDESMIAFFESGRKHVIHVLDVIKCHLDKNFSPKRILDFGCGTGRLIIPLAEIAKNVVGIDVSDSMLREAQKNLEKYSAKNVSLLKSDDNLSSLDGYFDFIHSFIVFQHIPVKRGKHIFINLLNHLADGGICAVQFIYSKEKYKKSHGMAPMKLAAPLRRLKRLLQEESPDRDPVMEMNPYDLNELLFIMQMSGVQNFFVEYTDHGGPLGIFLYFQKPKKCIMK